MVARAYGAATLAGAQAALNEEYRVAVAESLAGIETDDLRPLQQHLALIGPTLLAEGRIVIYFHDWWLGAKWGNKDCAQRLEDVLGMLSPGGGPWRQKTPEQKREKSNERKRRYNTRVTLALEQIKKTIGAKTASHLRQTRPNPENPASTRKKIEDQAIEAASKSPDKVTQKAAEKAKRLQKRELL